MHLRQRFTIFFVFSDMNRPLLYCNPYHYIIYIVRTQVSVSLAALLLDCIFLASCAPCAHRIPGLSIFSLERIFLRRAIASLNQSSLVYFFLVSVSFLADLLKALSCCVRYARLWHLRHKNTISSAGRYSLPTRFWQAVT